MDPAEDVRPQQATFFVDSGDFITSNDIQMEEIDIYSWWQFSWADGQCFREFRWNK